MANNDASADEADIDLKKRARRRLVGACALAIFGVVVLSLTMEQSPGPRTGTQDSPEIVIPSQSGRAALAARPAPAGPSLARAPVDEVKKSGHDPLPSPATTHSDPTLANAKEAPASAASTEQTEKTAEKRVEKNTQPALAKAAEKTVEHKADEAKASAALEGKSSGQWVVQLGAYQSSGNVKLLLFKLKGVGVPAYTEKFESAQGARTRVRAGPFASREMAEKALRKIRIVGVDGPIAQK